MTLAQAYSYGSFVQFCKNEKGAVEASSRATSVIWYADEKHELQE